ncbi:MAG: TasA family protein [Candidatus Bathyarchaeales archaeon]
MNVSKKILAAIVVIGLLGFALGWGTYSYFSDTETSSGNTFTAGTLDLKVNGVDDPLPVFFNVGNVKPGDSDSEDIILSNAGSLAGKAYVHFKNVVDNEGSNPEPETAGKLSNSLYIKVLVGDNVKAEGYLSAIACASHELGTIAGGDTLTVTIQWSIPSTVGNEIMGDSVTFDIEFSLVQA